MKTYTILLLIISGFLFLPSCSKSSDKLIEEDPKVDNPDNPDNPILDNPYRKL